MTTGLKALLLVGIVALGGFYYATRTDEPVVPAEGFTFRLTSLTTSPYEAQHGIQSFITLNMLATGGTQALPIDDPPPFPLTAILEYQTVDGQKRKVSSSNGYRC